MNKMKLTTEDGKEYELIKVPHMEFMIASEEPYPLPHTLSKPRVGKEGDPDYSPPVYKYKSLILGGALYAYKLIENGRQ